MEFPNFCLPYMANDAQLPSAQGCMTHLSWDESGPCVLGIAALWRRGQGHAATAWDGWRIAKMSPISTFRSALVALIPMVVLVAGGAALGILTGWLLFKLFEVWVKPFNKNYLKNNPSLSLP